MNSRSNDDSTSDSRRLLAHADSLYMVAHALTMNAVEASALVEAVYRRASREELPGDTDLRGWLLHLLREEAGMTGQAQYALGTTTAATGDFRRQLADRAVRRVLPLAFSDLARHERELLVLHYVERLDTDALATLLQTTSTEIDARILAAEASLRTGITAQLGAGERSLMEHLREGWMRDAINEMAVSDVPALPPTLRPSLAGPAPASAPTATPSRRRPRPREVSKRLQRALAVASIVFFTGLIGYVVSRVLETPPETNAITISARASDRARIEVASADAFEIRDYIQARTGWRMAVPQIEGAHLLGARITEPADGVRVPMIVYEDDDNGQRIVVLAYTYALIDTHGERLRFERETLEQIQDEGRYEFHDLGGKQVLVWRQRNAIFVAVTEGEAEALHARVYRSS